MYLYEIIDSCILLNLSKLLFTFLNAIILLFVLFMVISGLYLWLRLTEKGKSVEFANTKQISQHYSSREIAIEQVNNTFDDNASNGVQSVLKNQINAEKSVENESETKPMVAKPDQNPINLIFSSKTKTYKVKSSQLMYAVAENDGTRMYLKDKDFWLVLPLKEVLKQLPEDKFLRIFRSTVVNLDYIDAVKSKIVILENGEELTLSRTYKEEVKMRIGQIG